MAGSQPPPFLNIKDANGVFICNGNGTVNSLYANMSNSEILLNANVGQYFFAAKLNDQNNLGYAELYAQSLAFQADPAALTFNVPDNIFTNQFFFCVNEWASLLKQGISNPANNPACR